MKAIATPVESVTYKGIPASAGISIGPVWIYRPVIAEVKRHNIVDIASEIERFKAARKLAIEQLKLLAEKARSEIGEQEAAIFEAHQMFLEDPELIEIVVHRVMVERINVEAAVQAGIEEFAIELAAVDDEYLRARAADIRDVGKRLLNILVGVETQVKEFPNVPVIILAEDLSPSDTLQFDKSKILAFVTVRGGPTSHTAILANSLGIPAVVSLPIDLEMVKPNTQAILDGRSGEIILNPDDGTLSLMGAEMKKWREGQLAAQKGCQEPAVTLDGRSIEVVANIGNVEEARQALNCGAEGVGLFRTEFLFLDRNELPSEDEQVRAYAQIFDVLRGKPVVVRTLDIGGDKGAPYLGFKDESNPFLGWRAIRMMDERADVLLTQFKALLRAGVSTDLRIMVPMVSRLTEVEQARSLLRTAVEALEAEDVPICRTLQFGIMIEVPSAVLVAEHIAPLVDFFSIGTNDLTQYTMAVDRTNERVVKIASPFHPSVLRLIQLTIEGAHAQKKWVGLCGEFASNPLAVPFLLGLGLDEFSMSPASIPKIKDLIRQFSIKECREIAKRTLRLPKTQVVQAYLQSVVNEKTSRLK